MLGGVQPGSAEGPVGEGKPPLHRLTEPAGCWVLGAEHWVMQSLGDRSLRQVIFPLWALAPSLVKGGRL